MFDKRIAPCNNSIRDPSLSDYSIPGTVNIFTAQIPFANAAEEKKCHEMVAALSPKQLEQAACTSYAYYAMSHLSGAMPPTSYRLTMAIRMARRHLVAEKGNVETAMEKMLETLAFREEIGVDKIRQYYKTKEYMTGCADKKEAKLLEEIKELTETMCVCGYDVDNRAIMIKMPKMRQPTSDESFLISHLYCLERAIACTERKSNGEQEKIVLAVDYGGFRGRKTPPAKLMRTTIECFQKHYPERLQLFIASDPSALFRMSWRVLSPFIDPHTRKKVMVLHGMHEKEKRLAGVVHQEQAMPFLRIKGRLAMEVDATEFLVHTPFDQGTEEFFDSLEEH